MILLVLASAALFRVSDNTELSKEVSHSFNMLKYVFRMASN